MRGEALSDLLSSRNILTAACSYELLEVLHLFSRRLTEYRPHLLKLVAGLTYGGLKLLCAV